jgi:lipoprotein signal peptidase
MATYLHRYFSLVLVLSLLAPLWLGVASAQPAQLPGAMKTALVWSAILLVGWSIVRFTQRYQIRGVWRNPTPQESTTYWRLLLAVLVIDFGSKALFFRWDRPEQVEILPNFGLHSVFHVTQFESFHIILIAYFAYWFLLAPLYFRFANRALDRLWLLSTPFALGGALALSFERLLFGGVHDSFYFAGPLMWICPPCASPAFSSYAWTPADFFVHAAIFPAIILLLSYLPAPRKQPV